MDTFKRERDVNSKQSTTGNNNQTQINEQPEFDFSFFAEFSKLNISPIRKVESKNEGTNLTAKQKTKKESNEGNNNMKLTPSNNNMKFTPSNNSINSQNQNAYYSYMNYPVNPILVQNNYSSIILPNQYQYYYQPINYSYNYNSQSILENLIKNTPSFLQYICTEKGSIETSSLLLKCVNSPNLVSKLIDIFLKNLMFIISNNNSLVCFYNLITVLSTTQRSYFWNGLIKYPNYLINNKMTHIILKLIDLSTDILEQTNIINNLMNFINIMIYDENGCNIINSIIHKFKDQPKYILISY